MLVWGIITGIFWAVVIAAALWVLCAFSGKLVNMNFRMTAFLHVLCFVIAVPTIILLFVVFTCNKLHRLVGKVDSGIAKILLADGKFVDRLQQEINQASSTKDTNELTEYIAENFSGKISSEYPMLEKYANMDQLLKNIDLNKQLSGITKGMADVGKVQQIVLTATGSFTDGIRSKIKKVRRKALIAAILLQTVAFGVVFYRAGKYQKRLHSAHYNRKKNTNKKNSYR